MGTKYPSVAAVGYNASPPSDDGTVSASNQVFWNVDVKAKIGDPLKAYLDAVQAALVLFTNFGASTISGAYNSVAADHMTTLEASGTFTISLMDANTAGAGYIVNVKNVGSGVITVALVTATDTLDGVVNGTATIGALGSVTYKVKNGANGYYSIGANNSIPVSAPISSASVIGADCVNNTGTPNTKFDINCNYVTLNNPTTGESVVRRFPGVITNDVGLIGPAANGRDQAAAFSASSWIHFYYIWNGTTLATLSSANAPATGPAALPTGYTQWAYVGAVFFTGASQLTRIRFKGRTAYKIASQNVLNAGSSSFAAVSVASVVPPNALDIILNVLYLGGSTDGSGIINVTLDLSIDGVSVVNSSFNQHQGINTVHSAFAPGPTVMLPNVSQQFYYRVVTGNGSSTLANINCFGYTMPNGG